MESDGSDDGFARNQPGEALEIGDDQFDSEDNLDDQEDEPSQEAPQKPLDSQPKAGPAPHVKGTTVDNQHHDLAVDVNDSEEIDSEEEEDEVQMDNQQKLQPNLSSQQKLVSQAQQPQQLQRPSQMQQKDDDEDADPDADPDADEKFTPGAYNPLAYANLPVSGEVKELFEYIGRFKPQKIDLDTKIKPFIPDFIPAVGEVDSFLKMPKPDGSKEDLGITVLDEPALNNEDKTVLELKYVQSKNVVRSAPMDVDSIENADKKPKEIGRWITAVQDLHKTRPPPTVNYSKAMPEFDLLMEEWNPEMEQAFQQIDFPSDEIDMHVSDYARLICAMTDIPIHKSANNKSVIESLHVLFTLFVEFRNNQHFKRFQNADGTNDQEAHDLAQF